MYLGVYGIVTEKSRQRQTLASEGTPSHPRPLQCVCPTCAMITLSFPLASCFFGEYLPIARSVPGAVQEPHLAGETSCLPAQGISAEPRKLQAWGLFPSEAREHLFSSETLPVSWFYFGAPLTLAATGPGPKGSLRGLRKSVGPASARRGFSPTCVLS